MAGDTSFEDPDVNMIVWALEICIECADFEDDLLAYSSVVEWICTHCDRKSTTLEQLVRLLPDAMFYLFVNDAMSDYCSIALLDDDIVKMDLLQEKLLGIKSAERSISAPFCDQPQSGDAPPM
jgi:hypothetical protein